MQKQEQQEPRGQSRPKTRKPRNRIETSNDDRSIVVMGCSLFEASSGTSGALVSIDASVERQSSWIQVYNDALIDSALFGTSYFRANSS